MKQYLLYGFTGIVNLLVILIYFGLSAGFASYIPIVAIAGCLILFLVSTTISLFYQKIGALISLIACMLIIPFNINYLYYTFTDKNVTYDWIVFLFQVPSYISFITVSYSMKKIFNKEINWKTSIALRKPVRIILSLTPLILFSIYLYNIAHNFKIADRNEVISLQETIQDTWSLIADPMPVNYPQLYFKSDSTATFLSRGDTIYYFRYFLQGYTLVLKDINGEITKSKILRLSKDSLIFQTLRENKTIQSYIRKYK